MIHLGFEIKTHTGLGPTPIHAAALPTGEVVHSEDLSAVMWELSAWASEHEPDRLEALEGLVDAAEDDWKPAGHQYEDY